MTLRSHVLAAHAVSVAAHPVFTVAPLHSRESARTGGEVQFFSRARYLMARLDSTRRTVREFHVRKMYSARGRVFYDAGASQTEGPGDTHTAISSSARAGKAQIRAFIRMEEALRIQRTHSPYASIKFMKPIASRVRTARKFMFRDVGLCGEIDR